MSKWDGRIFSFRKIRETWYALWEIASEEIGDTEEPPKERTEKELYE